MEDMRVIEVNDFARLEEISGVEKGTMGSYTYVDDAWNYYWNTEGSFLAAETDDKIVGIAHLAVLPDKAGWFEALRVLPEYQNQGVGKALYEKAIELCTERYHCVSLSMYTGRRNVRSVGLAQKYGLVNEYEHLEYNYEVNCPATRGTFRNINWQRAQEIGVPLCEEYGGFVSVNRTWYRINEPNIRMMADKGYFYEDEK
ncbi:MAG: GNAT family N-acetyltransferase, partial [Erysipelotrichaceae bacterium]|nr:GNAT family N-acetyltransferase [Erysipelotrichaceae bacterium]